MRKIKLNAINTVITLLLFFCFTFTVFLSLFFGIQYYNSVQLKLKTSYYERTCIAYLSQRLRHSESRESFRIDKFDGLNALYFDLNSDENLYNSIIYYYDGWLYELFCEKGANFSREDGTRIVQADSVFFSEPNDGLIYITVTDIEGKTDNLYISLRSGVII